MHQTRWDRRGFAWLEWLLLLAVLALLVQLFPAMWDALRRALDVRGWSRDVWVLLNVLVLVALVAIRFRHEVTTCLRKAVFSVRRRGSNGQASGSAPTDPDYEARTRRDAEWRERAKKRLPFT
jgi:hypothetical protein